MRLCLSYQLALQCVTPSTLPPVASLLLASACPRIAAGGLLDVREREPALGGAQAYSSRPNVGQEVVVTSER